MKLRSALIAAIAVVLLASSCDILKKNIATTGPARYKSEVASLAGDMSDQLVNQGKLSPATRTKFDSLMSRYANEEVGKWNSYTRLKEAQDYLNKMETEPASAFQHKQQAEAKLKEALKALETEVMAE